MNLEFIKLWQSTHSSANKKHWHSGDSHNSILTQIPEQLTVSSLSKMTTPSDILCRVLSHEINIGNNPLASTIRFVHYNDKEVLVPESCGKIIPSADSTDQTFFVKIYVVSEVDSKKQGIVPNSSISVFCPSLGYQIFFIHCKFEDYNTDIKIGNYGAQEKIYKVTPHECVITYPKSDLIDCIHIPFKQNLL